ncbi:MAG: sugar phosphate isomerase/epimerase [Bryobacteraceae bacterium]|nr:sugar phosphate isomerase/epimerase [Bryobacteraceae bacterium]
MRAVPLGVLAASAGGSAPAGTARLKTAICAYSYRQALARGTMTYEDLVRLAAEQGVDGLDLTVYWFPSTSDDFLLPLRRLAYKNAVEIYSIAIRTDMCRQAPEAREKEVAEVRRWVDVAEKLGAGHIRVFGGNVPPGRTEEEAVGWVVETLQRSAEYAGRKGILLGLENHWGITTRAERIVEIVRKTDSPWVGINLDTGNFRENPYEQMEMCLPYTVNVQMKSEVRGAEGGPQRLDWERIGAMLARAGYRGFLSLEYEAAEDPSTAVPRLLAELRRLAARYSA